MHGTHRTHEQKIADGKAFAAKLDAVCLDAARYRWLMSGHAAEELAAAPKEGPAITEQDKVFSELSTMYFTKDMADALIDSARAA